MAGEKKGDEHPLSVCGARPHWTAIWLLPAAGWRGFTISIGTFLDEETKLHNRGRPPNDMQFNLWSERDDKSD